MDGEWIPPFARRPSYDNYGVAIHTPPISIRVEYATPNLENMKRIPLTQGKFAIVDDEDFNRINLHKWYAHKTHLTYYAVRGQKINGKCISIFMHREILGVLPGFEVDHHNGNGLYNRRKNLRICTRADNQHNQRSRQCVATSKFKGVYWNKQDHKWIAQIRLNGKHKYPGRFDNEIEAAKAYDQKAKELFGEFARTNF